jgi:dihydrolipoamide dehydrogenase
LWVLVDATHVAVAKADGTSETIEAKKYIATGSASSLPLSKSIKIELLPSTEALKLKEVPKHL